MSSRRKPSIRKVREPREEELPPFPFREKGVEPFYYKIPSWKYEEPLEEEEPIFTETRPTRIGGEGRGTPIKVVLTWAVVFFLIGLVLGSMFPVPWKGFHGMIWKSSTGTVAKNVGIKVKLHFKTAVKAPSNVDIWVNGRKYPLPIKDREAEWTKNFTESDLKKGVNIRFENTINVSNNPDLRWYLSGAPEVTIYKQEEIKRSYYPKYFCKPDIIVINSNEKIPYNYSGYWSNELRCEFSNKLPERIYKNDSVRFSRINQKQLEQQVKYLEEVRILIIYPNNEIVNLSYSYENKSEYISINESISLKGYNIGNFNIFEKWLPLGANLSLKGSGKLEIFQNGKFSEIGKNIKVRRPEIVVVEVKDGGW